MRIHLLLLFLWLFFSGFVLKLEAQENLIRLEKGSIDFKSDAPLEVIGHIKLSKRVTLNAEYIYVLPDQIASEFRIPFR